MSDLKVYEQHRRRNASKERLDAELETASATYFQNELSSVHEISVIENMTSFLMEHGGADVDSKVLRTIAEALSRRVHDTSPSTLKDVTMEHSYGVGFPCVSLQGHGTTSPPVQGRSVREFEEQMASLRKENFNLKLRLYFLEESVPGYHQSNQDNQESLMKQLIDTKVEIEILRKELEEKQELLREAAQAMNHMEQIQKETESKGQAFIDELKQKIQFLEMERDLDKTNQSSIMNDLLGHSEISGNVNAIQKIRELEGMVTHTEEKIRELQTKNTKMEDNVTKRDEAIKEYEEKVKELAFQNAELQEILENKERDMANVELKLKSVRLTNADLKEHNRNLIDALKTTQDNFLKEFSNMKACEKRMREQQDALSKMQSTISIKTANTARLLERIQDYEKMVTKINFERNLAKRENRFFRIIIGKLQGDKNKCLTIEKEEIYQQYKGHEEYDDEKPIDCNKYHEMNYHDMLKAHGDFHAEYLLKQKLCVNYSNSATKYNKMEKCDCDMPAESNGSGALMKHWYSNDNYSPNRRHQKLQYQQHHRRGVPVVGDGIDSATIVYDNELDVSDHEPEFPIRYTISDESMFADCRECGGVVLAQRISRSNSCSSLQPNFSTSSIFGGFREGSPPPDHREYMQNKRHNQQLSSVDGVRFVYSKFGNFQ